MRILVTGGAGFIGSHLVQKLLEEGHEVYNLDDLSNGKMAFLQSFINDPAHHLIVGSVLDRNLLKRVIPKVDVVYHLAAVLGVKNCVENPLKVIHGNVDGTKTILEISYQHGVKVIFASTSEVYGKNERLPFHENDDRILGSTAIHRWSYSTAKALDEHLCLAYAKEGLPVTILRYFNTYGPRATATAYGGVIPKFITSALRQEPILVYGNGKQSRCFTYVDDTVKASILALRPQANGLIINVGNHVPITIMNLAKKIHQLTRSSSDIQTVPYEQAYGAGYEDMFRRQPNIERMQKVLGFTPAVSLEEGLRKTIAWYKNHFNQRERDPV